MATVTLVISDIVSLTPNSKVHVRVQLTSDPPVADGTLLEDLTMAQIMGRVAVAAVVEAIEKHFNGAPSHVHEKPEN